MIESPLTFDRNLLKAYHCGSAGVLGGAGLTDAVVWNGQAPAMIPYPVKGF